MVGNTLASKLVEGGHEVMMGSRTRDNEEAVAWTKSAGARASQGTFADAAQFGEVVFNCTSGGKSIEALRQAKAAELGDRILIDVSNPLVFAAGSPPTLSVSNTDSLAEEIQREFPNLRVVKALNTVNASIMVNPALLPGDHDLFICGNDENAKAKVARGLTDWFGWAPQNIIDLGDITAARGMEMWLILWIRMMFAFKTPMFNLHIVRASAP